jgi:hypothetical protein
LLLREAADAMVQRVVHRDRAVHVDRKPAKIGKVRVSHVVLPAGARGRPQGLGPPPRRRGRVLFHEARLARGELRQIRAQRIDATPQRIVPMSDSMVMPPRIHCPGAAELAVTELRHRAVAATTARSASVAASTVKPGVARCSTALRPERSAIPLPILPCSRRIVARFPREPR